MISIEDKEQLEELDVYWSASRIREDTYYALSCKYLGFVGGKAQYSRIWLHKLIINCSGDSVIHHKNHNSLDNRRDNLEVTTRINNATDRKTRNSNNTSGYRNVSKHGKWWCVQLQINKKNTLLKKFPLNKVDEAGVYAELMRQKYYGEFAGSN